MTYILKFSHAMRQTGKDCVGSFWLLPATAVR
jgi:hypothetical protein